MMREFDFYPYQINPEMDMPTLDMESLRAATACDKLSGVKLRVLDLSALPVYEERFDLTRPHELLARMHPNTPFTTDRSKRVSAKEFIEWTTQQPNICYFQAAHPELGVIGHISAQRINFQDRSCFVSYAVLFPELWNQGLGARISKTGLDLLEKVGFLNIIAEADIDNNASVSIIKRQYPRKQSVADNRFHGETTVDPYQWSYIGFAM